MSKQLVIAINPKWRLVTDRTGWTLQQKRALVKGPRRGEIDWADEGHFDTLKWALIGAFKRMMRSGKGEASLKQLALRYEEVERQLLTAVASLTAHQEEIISDSPWDAEDEEAA